MISFSLRNKKNQNKKGWWKRYIYLTQRHRIVNNPYGYAHNYIATGLFVAVDLKLMVLLQKTL
jgi:hypothetical protein